MFKTIPVALLRILIFPSFVCFVYYRTSFIDVSVSDDYFRLTGNNFKTLEAFDKNVIVVCNSINDFVGCWLPDDQI